MDGQNCRKDAIVGWTQLPDGRKEPRKNNCDDSAPEKWLAERVFEVSSLQIIIE